MTVTGCPLQAGVVKAKHVQSGIWADLRVIRKDLETEHPRWKEGQVQKLRGLHFYDEN